MNNTNNKRSKLNLLLATMGMVFAGCAGDVGAEDDSTESGWIDEAQTIGISGPLPRSHRIEPGDEVGLFSRTCSGPDVGQPGRGDNGSVLELGCVASLTADECTPYGAARIGYRQGRQSCAAGTCTTSVTIKCLFKAD